MKKKISKTNTTKVNVKTASFSDLYALYSFVNGINNMIFGQKWEKIKDPVRNRFKEIEEELCNRAFGFNIFEKPEVVMIEGQDPLKVDLSKFDTSAKAVVVKGK